MTDTVELQLDLTRTSLDEEYASVKDLENCKLGEAKPCTRFEEKGISTAHFIEPVSLIAAVTIAWLAKRMVDHWLKSKEQGVQIDLSGEGQPIISRIAGVPRGFILVINKDGTKEVHKAKYDKPEDLMPLLNTVLAAG